MSERVVRNVLLGKISETEFLQKLQSKQWRHEFMAGAVAESLAIAVRENRKARGWTQKELGQKTKMWASRISVLETKKGMETVSLRTLLKLASAFDCALIVKFEAWEDVDVLRGFVSWVLGFTPEGCIAKKFASPSANQG